MKSNMQRKCQEKKIFEGIFIKKKNFVNLVQNKAKQNSGHL